VIGSKFRVHACPGATRCGYAITFTFCGLGFTSPQLDMPGLGQGFKGYKILIFLSFLTDLFFSNLLIFSSTSYLYLFFKLCPFIFDPIFYVGSP